MQPVARRIKEVFKFGDGGQVEAVTSYTYPVGVGGHHGELDVALVNRDCPGLLSRQAMKDLGCVVDFANDRLSVRAAGMQGEHLQYSGTGHPVLKMDDFGEELFPEKYRSRTVDDDCKRYYVGDLDDVETVASLNDTMVRFRGARWHLHPRY